MGSNKTSLLLVMAILMLCKSVKLDVIGMHQGGSKNGRRTLKIFWEDWYAQEILVSSGIKYDCFKLDNSGNRIIRKTWLHCI